MKHILTLLLSLITLSAAAQTHVTFLGHSFSDPAIEKKLEAENRIENIGGEAYELVFAEKNVNAIFNHVKDIKSNPVYNVHMFSEVGNWNDTEKLYFYFKNLFAKKYKIDFEVEVHGCEGRSLKPSTYAFHNIKEGDGMYFTKFIIPGGVVLVSILVHDKDEMYPDYGRIAISYQDDDYYEQNKQQQTDKILEDL